MDFITIGKGVNKKINFLLSIVMIMNGKKIVKGLDKYYLK
jgi:hypothetical protein